LSEAAKMSESNSPQKVIRRAIRVASFPSANKKKASSNINRSESVKESTEKVRCGVNVPVGLNETGYF
jgi:hypothetical protein